MHRKFRTPRLPSAGVGSSFVWLWCFAAASLLGGALGCGTPQDGGADCRDDDCLAPPAAVCDGESLVRFSTFGTCADGACRYAPTATSCERGCADGACVAAPTCADNCQTPPEPSCNEAVAVRATGPGTCADGVCDFPLRETDCAARGQRCQEGVCVPDSCAGGCPAPPPNCEDNTAVATTSRGCVDNACLLEESRTDCGALGQTCVAGACVSDACIGTVCGTPPPPACDGTFAVAANQTGICEDGACTYPTTRTNCAISGRTCRAGVCELPDTPTCAAGCVDPAPRCDQGDALTRTNGRCEGDRCVFDEVRRDCEAIGNVCVDGACVFVDTCAGITCTEPPAPTCDGSVAQRYEGAGVCAQGACSFPVRRTDCRTTGQLCVAGACVDDDPCDGVTCTAPPADRCDGDVLVDVRPELGGLCQEGTCQWETFRQDCAAVGGVCAAGRCDFSGLCTDVVCNTPPAPRCLGAVAVTFAGGACEDGVCRYTATQLACPAGSTCQDGACTDPCAGVVCDAIPAARCVGASLYTYEDDAGLCTGGSCSYVADITACDAVPGGYCTEASCRVAGFCDFRTCDTPPASVCDGRVVVSYSAPGTCADDACDYPEARVNCADSGQFCLGGACVAADPCSGVVCETPPRATCDADTRVSYDAGVCVEGACRYASSLSDCTATGQVCAAGVCVANDACEDVTCDPPPADRCEAGTAIRYGTPVCRDGGCSSPLVREDCTATGQFCQDGACVAVDPCQGVTCGAAPAAICQAGAAVRYEGPGVCQSGTCVYRPVTDDCAGRGEGCRNGACVVNPCEGVTCDAPPADACADDVTLLAWQTPGTCSFRGCDYEIATVSCPAEVAHGVCRDGACIDGCAGVVCDAPPEPAVCVGPWQVAQAVGACRLGTCVYEDALPVPCPTGQICVAGGCVVGTACDTLDCTDRPAAVCLDRARLERFIDTFCQEPACPGGDCGGPACAGTAQVVDCTAIPGAICTQGQCTTGRAPRVGELLITEFMAGTAGAGTQWIEVRNMSGDALRLSGLFVDSGAGESWTVPVGVMVGPSAYHLFRQTSAAPTAPDVDDSFFGNTLVLQPGGDVVRIRNATETIATLTWTAAWGVQTGVPHQANAGSVGVAPLDDPLLWCPAEDGVGTPGDTNTRCPEDP